MLNDKHAHSYFADRKEPFEKLWINVYGTFIEKITEAFSFQPLTICKADVLDNFLTIHNLLRGKNAYEVRELSEQLTVEIFHLLYKIWTLLQHKKQSETRFEQIRDYIRLHISDNISVNRICSDNFISKSTLYRMIKNETNMSPSEYIKNMKIDIACSILKKTNIDVYEIVKQLGFYDYSHFSKTFMSVKKISPIAFRKKYWNE